MLKKKIIGGVLALTMLGGSFASLTGCNGLLQEEGPKVDATKTTLQIFNQESGTMEVSVLLITSEYSADSSNPLNFAVLISWNSSKVGGLLAI